jgi:hypothetical protein
MTEEKVMKFESVPFMGQGIQVTKDEPHYVALKPLFEGMGLDWSTVYRQISNDEVLMEGVANLQYLTEGGLQMTKCLRMDMLQGVFFKVNAHLYKTKNPALYAVICEYQRECYKVLHEYFTQGFAVSDRISADDFERISKTVVTQKRRIEGQAERIVGLLGRTKALQCELGKKASQVKELVERNDDLVLEVLNNASLIQELQTTIEEQKALLDDYRPKGEPPEGATLVHSHWRKKPTKKAVSTPCQQPPPCPPTTVPHPESQVVVERNDDERS